MTTTGDSVTAIEPARVRLDRPVLIGNLVSGALWLVPLALFVSWPLLLVGAAYFVSGGLFLAWVYARPVLSRKAEALTWTAPWLVAALLWTVLLVGISFENSVSHYLVSLFVGLVLAVPCFLAWQILALIVRQLRAWRAGTARMPRPTGR